MFQSQLRYQSLHLLITEFLIHCNNELQRDLSLLRVAGIDTLLDLGKDNPEGEAGLRDLFKLILIFIEVCQDCINQRQPRYDMSEVIRIVLIYIGGLLEKEVY